MSYFAGWSVIRQPHFFICSVYAAACPRTTLAAFCFFGPFFWVWGFGLSEIGLLPSGLGGVSSKATAFIFVPSTVVPSWSPRSLWFFQIHRPSAPLCLSRPHFANDEAHVACTLSWLRLLGEHKCVTEAQTTTAATRKGRRNRKEYQCNSNKRLGMRATRDEP